MSFIDTTELVRLGVGLANAADDADATAENVNEETAIGMAKTAKRKAPKRTGRLARSIRAAGSSFTADVEYAGFVEYGTSRTGPQPFMRPAVSANTKQWESDLGDAAEELL